MVEPEANDDPGAIPVLEFVTVPEAKSGKNRVHLDLTSQSADDQAAIVDRLLAAGATRADIGQGDVPWVVLADPEGNELCVLEPRDRYLGRGPLASIVMDAADPAATGRFWAEASGWSITDETVDGTRLEHPDGKLPELELLTVDRRQHHEDPHPPRRRAVRRRRRRRPEVDRLVALGARPTDVGQGPDVTWVVLSDPEGNEFCVLSPR